MTPSSTVSRDLRINVKFATNQLAVGLLLVVASMFSTGCASLNTVQRSEYQAMKLAGVAVQEKDPVLGTVLGVLPGGGSFYTHQWGLGVADLLLWPTSILWDPFAGHSGAEVINYDITKAHLKPFFGTDREVAGNAWASRIRELAAAFVRDHPAHPAAVKP